MDKAGKLIPWTPGELEWVRKKFWSMTYRELTEAHNREFPDRPRTQGAIGSAMTRLDCRKRVYIRKFTPSEEKWILENGEDLEPKELGRQFRLKFRSARSNRAVYVKYWRLRGGAV